MQIRVVDLKLGASSLQNTPVDLPRITSGEAGLNLNYRALTDVAPAQLRILSVFSLVQGGQQTPKLLFFLQGERRPFAIDGFKIQYTDFPIVRADTVAPQLRAFSHYLVQCNPEVGVDRWTYDFLRGQPPKVLEKDIVILATALGGVLQQVDASAAGQ